MQPRANQSKKREIVETKKYIPKKKAKMEWRLAIDAEKTEQDYSDKKNNLSFKIREMRSRVVTLKSQKVSKK